MVTQQVPERVSLPVTHCAFLVVCAQPPVEGAVAGDVLASDAPPTRRLPDAVQGQGHVVGGAVQRAAVEARVAVSRLVDVQLATPTRVDPPPPPPGPRAPAAGHAPVVTSPLDLARVRRELGERTLNDQVRAWDDGRAAARVEEHALASRRLYEREHVRAERTRVR